MADDVGAALTGRGVLEDRRNEPWPTASLGDRAFLPVSPTLNETARMVLDMLYAVEPTKRPIPPATKLGIEAGIHDIGPLTDDQVLRHMIGE